MNKSKIIAFISITILCLSALVVFLSQSPSKMNLQNLMVSAEKWDEITEKRKLSRSPLTAEICFNKYALFTDTYTDTLYYSLTDDDYNPTVTVNTEGIEVVFLEESVSAEKTSQNEIYRVLLYNETLYSEYDLIITSLPLISINTHENTRIEGSDVLSDFTLYDNGDTSLSDNRITSSNASIRTRGASSQVYPQKSYRISLLNEDGTKNKKNLLGLRDDEDWILYSPYNDPEKMRQMLAWEFWNNIGAYNNSFSMPNTVSGEYVELFIDDRYAGLYVLMYPLDAKQLDLQSNENLEKSEYLYRSVSYQTTAMPVNAFEPFADTTVAYGYELRFPKENIINPLKWKPLENFFYLLQNAPDDEFSKEIPKMIEVENVVDFWLFVNTVSAVDNVGKNTNYTAKKTESGYKVILAPWDLDQTWGNYWTDGAPLLTTVRPDTLANEIRIHLMDRLCALDIENVADVAYDKWQWLRSNRLSDEAVMKMIDNHEKRIYDSGAILRNSERWPNTYTSDNTDDFRSYVLERLDFVDCLVKERLLPSY